jgi:GNAT superfamily N-acetyltransferase
MEDANAAVALADALALDPFYVHVSALAADSRAALTAYFAAALVEGRAAGRVVSSSLGAAIWALPGESAEQRAAYAARRVALIAALGEVGLARFDRVVAGMAAAAAPFPEIASAYYLSILGVRPSAQRTGVGRRLMEQTLREADEAGVSCWLETFGKETLPFYAALGFRPLCPPILETSTGSCYNILLRTPSPTQPR